MYDLYSHRCGLVDKVTVSRGQDERFEPRHGPWGKRNKEITHVSSTGTCTGLDARRGDAAAGGNTEAAPRGGDDTGTRERGGGGTGERGEGGGKIFSIKLNFLEKKKKSPLIFF